MPSESPTAKTKLLCLFKSWLVVCYLTVMSYGALVYPEIISERGEKWYDAGRFRLSYGSLYQPSLFNIGMHLVLTGSAMLALFISCRCKFYGATDYILPPLEGKRRFWPCLLAPYLAHFFVFLLGTVLLCGIDLWQILVVIGVENLVGIFRDVLILLLVKCLIGASVVRFLLRSLFVVTECPDDDAILNEYDFGDHLNIIFKV